MHYFLYNNRNDEVAVDYVNQIDYEDMVTSLLPVHMDLHCIDLEVDY